jgi:striatin 1/3/4
VCVLIPQARIALLEGQRRSAENLKVDLLRRVKMLEFALRQERCVVRMYAAYGRTKTVSTAGKSTLAPSRLSILQDEDRGTREETPSEAGDDAGMLFSPRVPAPLTP